MHRLSLVLLVAACAPTPTPAPDTGGLVLLRPYRSEGDPCRLAGESAATIDYLDDAADLVACPAGMENPGTFPLDTGGTEVARTGGYVLYSVPRR